MTAQGYLLRRTHSPKLGLEHRVGQYGSIVTISSASRWRLYAQLLGDALDGRSKGSQLELSLCQRCDDSWCSQLRSSAKTSLAGWCPESRVKCLWIRIFCGCEAESQVMAELFNHRLEENERATFRASRNGDVTEARIAISDDNDEAQAKIVSCS